MKIINNMKMAVGLCAIYMTSLFSSCNFLDIVPVEQPDLEDATQDYNSTLGFLYSCYKGIQDPYYSARVESAADEYGQPYEWSLDSWNYGIRVAYDLQNPNTGTDRWQTYYRYINQVLLFLQELPDAPVPDAEKKQWAAEAKFLLAYYHFELLRFYGPIPIIDKVYPSSTLPSEYPGRSHYDYVTDWIVKLLDEEVLPDGNLPTTRGNNETGRATYAIAMALKSRVLLNAASPLWNGRFPYPEWKNVKNGHEIETPGYGIDLVSNTYNEEKWKLARKACDDALNAAIGAGHKLYDVVDSKPLRESQSVELPYIPYRPGEVISDDFREKVMMLRYLITAQGNEGNKEFVWQLSVGDSRVLTSTMPNHIAKYNNGTEWRNGWSGVGPYLNTIERFYTKNGVLPKDDNTLPKLSDRSKWLERAGVEDLSRPDIVNLYLDREPRFYAWMAFDQGDWSSKAVNGVPLKLDMKSSNGQGYNPKEFNRNHTPTGFFTQKYITPNFIQNTSSYAADPAYPRSLIRMGELYLNLAECEAVLGETTECLGHLNAIRKRAGIRELTTSDITDAMPLLEWVKNERFIELWGEGIRYFDVRRWAEGKKYLSAGIRKGLNAKIENPTFEEFNQEIVVPQPYKWTDRMNLFPLYYKEVDNNPNLVQAPGY